MFEIKNIKKDIELMNESVLANSRSIDILLQANIATDNGLKACCELINRLEKRIVTLESKLDPKQPHEEKEVL